MPCTMPDYNPLRYNEGDPRNEHPPYIQLGEIEENRRTVLNNWIKEVIEKYKARIASDEIDLNDLTRLLCAAGKAYVAKQEMPIEVVLWWGKHCAFDKARGESWDVELEELGAK